MTLSGCQMTKFGSKTNIYSPKVRTKFGSLCRSIKPADICVYSSNLAGDQTSKTKGRLLIATYQSQSPPPRRRRSRLSIKSCHVQLRAHDVSIPMGLFTGTCLAWTMMARFSHGGRRFSGWGNMMLASYFGLLITTSERASTETTCWEVRSKVNGMPTWSLINRFRFIPLLLVTRRVRD